MSAMQGMPQQVPSMQQIAAQQRVYQPGETINYVDSGKVSGFFVIRHFLKPIPMCSLNLFVFS